eukprot:CAMPEP_0185599546 /NCGR_PEP_ID=MMETSP0434-20130131/82785_1 /TAXON_ID=626734 ORGANISM="Favella taraikaensis, Strain Fe Narragansett Bay" /NCGR_SAMPLE_ID=MMETSP0434 /ASSEMBLY_ACC=CAM_ASM_000379 /LENGTH=90 /DNA_ID=CAMNT_0028228997 /DNA_START=1180 /DNA_END=1452 /DNA_ORIENTATION=+
MRQYLDTASAKKLTSIRQIEQASTHRKILQSEYSKAPRKIITSSKSKVVSPPLKPQQSLSFSSSLIVTRQPSAENATGTAVAGLPKTSNP